MSQKLELRYAHCRRRNGATGAALYLKGGECRKEDLMIGEANRVSASWVHERLQGLSSLPLVCAYDDERCRSVKIPGSITLRELNERLPSLPKDQELVFYCG